MERKIGEIFEIEGQWYQCLKGLGCNECDLPKINCFHIFESGYCSPAIRNDGTQVIFKKLEKIGKPYLKNVEDDITYQMYKLPMNVDELICQCYWISLITSNIVEIAQTKEDMTESKLKPFNLEQAKAGKSVCTRDGRKARIICFDRVTNSTNEYTGHLIVLVTNLNGDEKPFCYTENGNLAGDEYDNHEWDLMMFSEKKSGWANVIKGNDGRSYMGRGIFQSKEDAENAIKAFSSKLIDTIKVEWYE